jgi:hypothetical protein
MFIKGESSEKILEENPVVARADQAMLTVISSIEEATFTEMEITKNENPWARQIFHRFLNPYASLLCRWFRFAQLAKGKKSRL